MEKIDDEEISFDVLLSQIKVEAYFRFLTLLPYAPNTNGNAAKVFDEVGEI